MTFGYHQGGSPIGPFKEGETRHFYGPSLRQVKSLRDGGEVLDGQGKHIATYRGGESFSIGGRVIFALQSGESVPRPRNLPPLD
jgi:hypothetical protein